MDRLILVGGIPASGKTGFAWTLEAMTGALSDSADLVYYDIARELQKEPRSFANPREWQKIPEERLAPLKARFYAEHIARMPGKTIILEGIGVSFEDDRKAIIAAAKPREILFFQMDVGFEEWLLQKKKARDASAWREYSWLCGQLTVPNVYDPGIKTTVYRISSGHIPGRLPERHPPDVSTSDR